MMQMTSASFKEFYENVDKSMLWSICHRGGNERGATATNPKMVPQQHIGSGNSIEMPVQMRVWREHVIRIMITTIKMFKIVVVPDW